MSSLVGMAGIEPTLYTLLEEDFPIQVYGTLKSESLIDFAYDEYYSLFEDEGHYMIFVVKCNDGEYLWCEMAGDNTISLIDEEAFSDFQVDMLALTKDSDVAEVIMDSFKKLEVNVFKITLKDKFVLATISFATLAIIGVVIINLVTELKKVNMMNEYCDYKQNPKGSKTEHEFKTKY